jgi:hypothetical protein
MGVGADGGVNPSRSSVLTADILIVIKSGTSEAVGDETATNHSAFCRLNVRISHTLSFSRVRPGMRVHSASEEWFGRSRRRN